MDHEPDDLTALMQRRRALKLLAGAGARSRTRRARRLRHRRRFGRERHDLDHLGLVVVDSSLVHHVRGDVGRRRDPRGDRRALPGRRLQRAERADRERDRPQRHHAQLRVLERHRRGRAPHDRADDRSTSPTAARRWPAPRSTSGTAPGRAATRCTPRASPTRTSCGACRRPAATARSRSQSIFPARYDGRWPHIHFEVYPTLDEATAAGDPTATSQIALPEDICDRGLRDRRLRAERRAT